MKGDFSRLTFNPGKQFSRVLMQQGRVQLDADWNEQGDILLHSLRTLAADLIGPFGGPANPDGTPGDGFRLAVRRDASGKLIPSDFVLLPGRYYVGGISCENREEWIYSQNVDAPLGTLEPGTTYMLYLDVWERHVIYLQDEVLREVALGGADTATRAQVVWRVRAVKEKTDKSALTIETTCQALRREWSRWVERWQPKQRGKLKARAKPGTPDDTDPCLSSPDARYRGENQLYRVEIHTGGTAGPGGATFKWSSDNGSVVYPILKLDTGTGTATVTLEHLGRDDRSGLTQGDWVESADGEEDLRDGIDPLLQVDKVDPDTMQVILKGQPSSNIGQTTPSRPLLLRRWDHRRSARKPGTNGVFPVKEGDWLELEDGVQIFFDGTGQSYRSGDYWLIPARVATGDVEWPGPANAPWSLPPHGVEHHYAPLGLVTLGTDSVNIKDCRTTFGCRAVRLNTGVADWQLVSIAALSSSSGSTSSTEAPPAAGTQATNLIAASAASASSSAASPSPRAAVPVAPPNPAWGALPGASWISSSADDGNNNTKAQAGVYTYELSFNLCSCFHNAGLSLSLLADNSATVSLNEVEIALGATGFNGNPALIESPGSARFQVGRNVLRVVVKNDAGPTGFVLSGIVDADGCLCC